MTTPRIWGNILPIFLTFFSVKKEAKTTYFHSFFRPFGGKRQSRALWRRERTKRLFSYFLWHKERSKEIFAPPRPPRRGRMQTNNRSTPSIISMFWYRGTRDGVFIGWRIVKEFDINKLFEIHLFMTITNYL